MNIHHQTNNHAERRRKEYPEIGDQLDAIYKLAVHLQEEGVELPESVLEWMRCCRKVKDNFPFV